MTYQIQLKKDSTLTTPLWQDYGSITTVDGETVFTPITFDDIEALQTKLEELDKAFGYENLRAIAIPEFTVKIEVETETNKNTDDNSSDSTEDPT